LTRYKDNTPLPMDSGKVNKWIRDNISGINRPTKYVEVIMRNNKVIEINIDKTLTAQDKAKLISKFPELAGKEDG